MLADNEIEITVKNIKDFEDLNNMYLNFRESIRDFIISAEKTIGGIKVFKYKGIYDSIKVPIPSDFFNFSKSESGFCFYYTIFTLRIPIKETVDCEFIIVR